MHLSIIHILFFASCVNSEPTPQAPPIHSMDMPRVETAAHREAREAIEPFERAKARCASNPTLACAVQDVRQWHPCDPPRRTQLPGSMLPDDAPAAKHGKWFYDGSACYQATPGREGKCGWLHRCQAWSTLEACQASREICTGLGR